MPPAVLPCGKMSAPKWLLLMSVSPGRGPVTFCLSQRLSKIHQMCLTQPPFKLLSVLWDLEILCGPFKAGVAFPVDFWLSHMQAQLACKARLSGGLILMQFSWAGEPSVELETLIPVNLCYCDYPSICGSPN